MKLKICGMRDKNNIREVSAIGVDYMGFIFYPKSPRYVGDNFEMPVLPSSIKKVGVFVNAATDEMKRKSKDLGLDYLQLHGQETIEQCSELTQNDIRVIKVFSIDDHFDFELTKPYKGVAEFFLFDTKGKYYGGNAATFNWQILEAYDQEVPFFLSGGIGPDNIGEIDKLKDMNLHAIDANSGVEINPAMKDIPKVSFLKQYLTNTNF